jgi:hypothetical protein
MWPLVIGCPNWRKEVEKRLEFVGFSSFEDRKVKGKLNSQEFRSTQRSSFAANEWSEHGVNIRIHERMNE